MVLLFIYLGLYYYLFLCSNRTTVDRRGLVSNNLCRPRWACLDLFPLSIHALALLEMRKIIPEQMSWTILAQVCPSYLIFAQVRKNKMKERASTEQTMPPLNSWREGGPSTNEAGLRAAGRSAETAFRPCLDTWVTQFYLKAWISG